MLASTLLALLPIGASLVNAAALLDIRAAPTVPIVALAYPPSRGLSLDTNKIAPCGGYAIGGRINYPLTGGDLSLTQSRDAKDLQFSYSTSANPQSVSDFKPLLAENITQLYKGTTCVSSPNLTTLGLSAGDQITIKVEYQSGPSATRFYECADLNLVAASSFTKPTYNCTNIIESTQTRGNAAQSAQSVVSSAAATAQASSSSVAAAAATSTSAISGASNLKIGGMGTLGFLAVLAAFVAL
ncbi:hypothetical protein [Phaffia rhodozyma]|uniref:Copper acquisition factor BIM1-like domain-containing protein n=1 Tax=Phaffia rhodozyma TaxID=264483 RepID=A0A0F7SF61_PHARH|nr:hypothetical protein [Phaffia rhodozyma]